MRADPFYYLNNFQTVLATLAERYQDLLSTEERRFLAQFGALPRAARALLVRMVMRKGALFRESKLNYAEIGDTRSAVQPLVAAGWVDDRAALRFEQLHGLLTKAQLAQHFGLGRAERQRTKARIVVDLRGRFAQAQPYESWCARCEDRVYRLLIGALCERFRLMFFGNFRQGWSEFVLADLGIFSYERFARSEQSRAFRSREHVEVFQQLYRCRERLHSGDPPQEVRGEMPAPVNGCDWLEDRRQRLLFQIARAHERARDWSAAAAIYATCTHPGSRSRAVRICERNHDWAAARALCLGGEPLGEAEREHLQRLVPRLNRKLGIAGGERRRAWRVPEFELLLERPATGRAVEYLVRDHLAQGAPDGTTVQYVENGLINSLFGLLCWGAIFAPIPGAFFHDFHRAPADFASGEFYRRRRREFDRCLAELDGDYRQIIRRNFSEKTGIQSPFVAWGLLSEPLLDCALACFPADHLRCWFEWITRDVQRNRSGFPDLVQFWPAHRRYRLIEVKGPGDRLQHSQRRLLEFCESHRMPVAVCRVKWAAAGRACELPLPTA